MNDTVKRRLPEVSGVLTWADKRSQHALLYIPYLQSIQKKRGDNYVIEYNGGRIEVELSRVDGIMFYGASGELPLEFLDAANRHRVPLTFHRTHIAEPYVLTPSLTPDRNDLLTAQILHREDARRCVYIARCLIGARIQSMQWLIKESRVVMKQVRACRSLEQLRQIEAAQTKRYWRAYYAKLGLQGLSRREKHPVNQSLDACSRFLSGIVLRWVLFHRLSASHGFLHEPTNYVSLVYDLMEPYRYLLEKSTLFASEITTDEKKLISESVTQFKRLMNTMVYVPITRQKVYRKALLHGSVLALRAYLLKSMSRFVLPVEGKKCAGRPIKCSYRLLGEVR